MREFGPLKNFSTMRFEGKYKQLKDYSKVITSRKCPVYSLSLKHQMQLCHRFVCNEGFSQRLSHGPFISKLCFVNNYDNFKFLLPMSCDDCYCVSWIRLYGTRYEINNFINIQTYDSPVFGNIKYIVIDKSKNVFFLYYKFIDICYYEHYGAFNAKESTNWGFIAHYNLIDFKVYDAHVMSDKHYIFSVL